MEEADCQIAMTALTDWIGMRKCSAKVEGQVQSVTFLKTLKTRFIVNSSMMYPGSLAHPTVMCMKDGFLCLSCWMLLSGPQLLCSMRWSTGMAASAGRER